MQRIVIADQAGKQRHVAFADGSAARMSGRVDFEILEIKPQAALPCTASLLPVDRRNI
jgi:prepilin-type processing-associated H-X9-DG protein